ncbi:sensor domain-containing protein [Mycolicibacterium thermoresistibile]
MPRSVWPFVVWCVAGLLSAGCASTVDGTAVRAPARPGEDSRSPVDIDALLLSQSQMRAITGAGDDLTVIPSMDGKIPVDIEQFAETTPAQCAWIFQETQTFGPHIEDFHKTTFQHPARSALISQGAAGYSDTETARDAFDDLTRRVDDCGTTPLAPMFVGSFSVQHDSVHIRTGASCGRDYRVQSVVLVEVTFCGFPESVPDMVMTNILAKLPR